MTSRRETPTSAQRCASSPGESSEHLRPALDRHAPVADVDRDHERAAEALDRRLEKTVPERRRADHHPVGARVERRGDRVERPVAASDLEGQAARVSQTLDELEARHAGERAVEVDQMEARGSFGREPSGEADRVTALERHGVALASREPDGAAAEDVDRGYHVEATC